MRDTVETTAYLQIERDPRWRWQGVARRVTKKRPEEPLPNAVVVKVKIIMPVAAFEPLEPSAVIEVPESLVQHPVEVVADESGA